jgi:hypothetical protein
MEYYRDTSSVMYTRFLQLTSIAIVVMLSISVGLLIAKSEQRYPGTQSAYSNQNFSYSIKQPEATATTSATVPMNTKCGLSISVSDGLFNPGICSFQISSRALTLEDTTKGHVQEVTLFNIKDIKRGTYYFYPPDSTRERRDLIDFKGQLIDQNNKYVELESGQLILNPVNGKMQVSFDLVFANNTKVKGSGAVPISGESTP